MQDAEHRPEGDTLSLRDYLHHWLSKLTPPVIAILAVLGVGLIGVLDYLTGYEFSFSLFYLVPVALAAWYDGQILGLVIAVLSACVWFVADLATGHS